MAFISFEQAGGRNVVAFLDMVAWAEGTDKPSQPTKDHGYDVLVGGGPFDRYADHPYVPALRVFLPQRCKRQVPKSTWMSLRAVQRSTQAVAD
ncbi:hypothetical protein [Xanthomonas oryzae]|uniref:hypothetical protein n=1 Tax=Xanthomonas oryzae TaxID=347 RepID=UPI003D08A191